MILLHDYDAKQWWEVFKLTIRNIIYMRLAIIMGLLNTITMKTRQNTTPADPNCVNFQQCISQNDSTVSAFRWKTHFLQSTQDVKSNKKYITGKVLLVHEGTEESRDTAPSIYNLNATYRSVVGLGHRFLYTTVVQTMTHGPHFACWSNISGLWEFQATCTLYSCQNERKCFNDLVNFT